MSHALATTLHRGRKAASNVMAACLASSRGCRVRRQGTYSVSSGVHVTLRLRAARTSSTRPTGVS